MESPNSKKDDCSSLHREKPRGDFYLCPWNGFWLPNDWMHATEEILNLFKPLPTDVILASFPKTGTTWLKALLYSIINRTSRNTVLATHPQMLVPALEIDLYGTGQPISLDAFPGTNSTANARLFATHLPYQILAKIINPSDCRVVYITRNPKDTLISMWQFRNKSKVLEPWPLEVAQEEFCNGVLPGGPYFDHVLGYWKESFKQPKKIFFITYEELKNDCKTHVKRLAQFLGCPFDGADKEEVLDEIVRNCSFKRLSNYEVNKSTDSLVGKLKFPSSSYFRQGEVGDYKNYLNAEIIKRVDSITLEKFHGSGFMYGI